MKKYKGLCVPNERRSGALEELWGTVKDNSEKACNGDYDCGGLNCGDCIFSWENHEFRYEYLKAIFVKEEGEKKMFDYKLWSGAIVETKNEDFYMYINDDKVYQIYTRVGDIILSFHCKLEDIAEDITQVYNPDHIADIHCVLEDREDARNKFNVWTKEACLELTMEELEQRLGIKVKIVKEHK